MAARTAALLGERIARQGLVSRAGSVVEAVAVTTAVQSQDTPAARLGVRVRSTGLTDAEVVAALDDERTVVRTWLHRATIHLVPAADLRWLVALVGPSVMGRCRARWHQLGLTDAVLDASLPALTEILCDGPLDRHRIAARLQELGVLRGEVDGSVATQLLVHASAAGLVCRGADDGRAGRFALVDRWLPPTPAGPSGEDALAELARRYFAAYSPATAADFVTWCGLAGQRAVALIRDELTEADVDGRAGFRLGEVEPARGVQLLPAFDNYVLGYRDRTALVPQEHYGAVYQGGVIHPTVVVDGRVAGRWRIDRVRGRLHVTPFGRLRRVDVRGIEAEAADVARFLDRPLELQLALAD